MDDLDYFFPGADDAAYRGYADPRGARPAGRRPSPEQPGSVWQRLADGPWSPLGAPVPGQFSGSQGRQREDPGFGWPGTAPSRGPWPQAPQPRGGYVREAPPAWSPYPAPEDDAADEVPPARRPRDRRPPDKKRGRGPRRRPAPDGTRRPPTRTSLLSGYAPETGPVPRIQRAAISAGPPAAAAYGRALPDWLPFGHRLVMLPKEAADDEMPRAHRDVNGGWLRPAVFGAMDGLVTNASLIAGIVGIRSLPLALIMAGLFAFAGGAAVARLTGRPAGLGGFRQLAAVFPAAGMAFFIGHLIGAHVG